MNTLTTLIIESDDIIRKRLKDVIQGAGGIWIAGITGDPDQEKALQKVRQANPDVLLLGIDRVDSEEMVLFESLRTEYPDLPVIVLPRHNKEGGEVALKALKNGAVEYVNKTMSFSGAVHNSEHFAQRLVPVMKAVPRFNKRVLASTRNLENSLKDLQPASDDEFDTSLLRKELLVIVGCLGGVPALYMLLSSLPERMPVPVVIVQHMPKIYTQVMAEDLAKTTSLPVMEAREGMVLEAGKVYVAPGGHHSTISHAGDRLVINLSNGHKVQGFKPSIDVLLKSVRSLFGNKVLTVYLSGGGKDGIEGAEVMDTAGGQVIIQNRSSSLLWDLPFRIDVMESSEGSYPLEYLGRQVAERLYR